MFSEISRPGCVVAHSGPLGKPVECHAPPTHAGLVFFEYPRSRVWLVFACDVHRGELSAARPILGRDRAELARRAEARRRVLEEGATTAPLEPLAVGGEARRLVERARAWASRTDGTSVHSGHEGGAGVGQAGARERT